MLARIHVPFGVGMLICVLGPLAWRFQTASAFLPTVIMLALIFVCPGGCPITDAGWFNLYKTSNTSQESPRFLIKRGGPKNYAKAYRSLVYLRGSPLLAAKELFYVHCQIDIEKRLLSQPNHDTESKYISEDRQSENLERSDDASESHSELKQKQSRHIDGEANPEIVKNRARSTLTPSRTLEFPAESTDYLRELWQHLKTPSGRAINYWQKLGQLLTERRIRRVFAKLPLLLYRSAFVNRQTGHCIRGSLDDLATIVRSQRFGLL